MTMEETGNQDLCVGEKHVWLKFWRKRRTQLLSKQQPAFCYKLCQVSPWIIRVKPRGHAGKSLGCRRYRGRRGEHLLRRSAVCHTVDLQNE